MIPKLYLTHQRRKNTPLIHLYLILRTAFMQLMSSVCTPSKSALVLVLILMIGQSALLFIQVKMLGEGILGSTITAVFLALISEKELVGEGICVSMLMEFLSVGSTQLNTEHASARMAQVVLEEFVSLLMQLMNSDLFMYLLVLLFPHPAQVLQALWILLQQ